jgi:hypothetical protein
LLVALTFRRSYVVNTLLHSTTATDKHEREHAAKWCQNKPDKPALQVSGDASALITTSVAGIEESTAFFGPVVSVACN